jgi:hypothetical protein
MRSLQVDGGDVKLRTAVITAFHVHEKPPGTLNE